MSSSTEMMLKCVQIYADVLHRRDVRFVSLFAIYASRKSTDRKRQRERGKECSPRREGVSAYAFARFLLAFKKKKQREKECVCVYVCLKEREQKGCLVILSRSLAFIRDHHLLTTTTVQKRKKNPRRRNFLENVTFVLSSARVFKLRLTYVSFLRNESVMFAVLRQLHCVSTCDQIRVRGIYSSYQYLGMKTIERFAS